MFGYVKVYEDELLVRHWKKYKASYCALCKQIGNYSQTARLMLSYDMVFCVLLSEAPIPKEKKECKHKLLWRCKKCSGDISLQYIAAVSVILQYYKLKDDIADGKRSRWLVMKAIERGYSKAKSDFPEFERRVSETMSKLNCLEKEKCTDIGLLDNCFPHILYDVFSCAPRKDDFDDVRCQISQHVASWVYWFDMLHDVEDDRKSGNFNVILQSENETNVKEYLLNLLIKNIISAERLCDLLPYSDEMNIVHNIITAGLPQQMISAGMPIEI